jgi:hypothetical protein
MEKMTKNQHYVFRAYLKPWAEEGLIYCLRGGQIFRPNLTGVACERFFYRLQDLTPQELQLIEKLFSDHPSEALKTAQRSFMSLYSFPTKLKKRLADTDPRFRSALDRAIAEGEEDYHQRIEDSLLVFLNKMLAGNTDFYSDSEQSANFLYALCVQYTRTKQIREALVGQIGTDFGGCDVRRMTSVLASLAAMAVAYSLYMDRKTFKLVLLDNNTDTPLITADQPIVNLRHDHTGKPPEKFELYYPISPRKAMLLVESSSGRADFPLSAVSVNGYNMMMINNSHEQVFSNSEEYLNGIKSFVGYA